MSHTQAHDSDRFGLESRRFFFRDFVPVAVGSDFDECVLRQHMHQSAAPGVVHPCSEVFPIFSFHQGAQGARQKGGIRFGCGPVAHSPLRHLSIQCVVLFEDRSALAQRVQADAVRLDGKVEQFRFPEVGRRHIANSTLRFPARQHIRRVVNIHKGMDIPSNRSSLRPEVHLQMAFGEGVRPVSKAHHGGLRFGADGLLFHPQHKPSIQADDQLLNGMNGAL